MIKDLGTVRPGTTIYVPFHTFDSNDPSASVTITGLATTDIEIYKDGSVTQRASDAGYTLLDTDGIDFDATTGIHGVSIDLADNTTAGFYAAGSQYMVVIASITVDAATINFIPVTFTIGYPDAVINTTIATLSSQTSFTLTSGPAENDALNGCVVCIHDVASAVQLGFAVISDYVGATKTVTLTAGVTFTAAATDNISIYPPANTQWITSTAQTANDNGADINTLITRIAQTLNLTASGNIGIDWANVENQSTAVDLSATDIQLADTTTTVTNDVGLTATAIDNIYDESSVGHTSSGTMGWYGIMAAGILVDGTVTGTPTSTTFDFTGGSTSNNFYKDQLVYIVSGTGIGQVRPISASSYSGGTTTITVDEAYIVTPAASDRFVIQSNHVHPLTQMVDSVWDEATSGHTTAGTTGKALTDTLADTNELQGDWANGGRLDLLLDAVKAVTDLLPDAGALNDLAAILALLDDARTEPGQGNPPVNPDLATKIDYLYKWTRNKRDNDGTTTQFYADDGTTVDQKQTTSSSGGTVTKGEISTGP